MSLSTVPSWAEQHLRARHDYLRDDFFLNGCSYFFKSCGLGSVALNGLSWLWWCICRLKNLYLLMPGELTVIRHPSDQSGMNFSFNSLRPGPILTHILSSIAALAQICRGELLRKIGKPSDILISKYFLYDMKSALSVRNLLFASLR